MKYLLILLLITAGVQVNAQNFSGAPREARYMTMEEVFRLGLWRHQQPEDGQVKVYDAKKNDFVWMDPPGIKRSIFSLTKKEAKEFMMLATDDVEEYQIEVLRLERTSNAVEFTVRETKYGTLYGFSIDTAGNVFTGNFKNYNQWACYKWLERRFEFPEPKLDVRNENSCCEHRLKNR